MGSERKRRETSSIRRPSVSTMGRVYQQEARPLGLAARRDTRLQPSRQAGRLESMNGKFRTECLDANWFTSLDETRRKCEAWRGDDNEVRPHRAIGNEVPESLHRATRNPGQLVAR
jgi:transposase InsO family protein